MKYLNKIVKIEKEQEEKRDFYWLNVISDRDIVRFCENNLQKDKRIKNAQVIRYIDQTTTDTLSFALVDAKGNEIYTFTEFYAVETEKINDKTEYTELLDQWLCLVVDINNIFNKNAAIYCDRLINKIVETFDNSNDEVKLMLEALSLYGNNI